MKKSNYAPLQLAAKWLNQTVTIVKAGGLNAPLMALVPEVRCEIPLRNAPEPIQHAWNESDDEFATPTHLTTGFVIYAIQGDVPSEQKKNLKTKPIEECLAAPRGVVSIHCAELLFSEVEWTKRFSCSALIEKRKLKKDGTLERKNKSYERIITARSHKIAKAKMLSKYERKGALISYDVRDLTEHQNWGL